MKKEPEIIQAWPGNKPSPLQWPDAKLYPLSLKKFWLDQSRKYDVFHDVFPGYYNRPQEIEDNAYANFSEDKQGLL